MHVTVDLGLSSLVLVVCVVFPAIVFVIRKKWQIAVERDEEVKRLLALLSEETARAEVEAAFSYGGASASYLSCSTSGLHQCAVCFCQTTTRCSRCKNVRYCSGKCQIIHWRQGHKDKCLPPSTACRDSDGGSTCAQKISRSDAHEASFLPRESSSSSLSSSSSSSNCRICSDMGNSNHHGELDFVADMEQKHCDVQSEHMDSSRFSCHREDNESDASHRNVPKDPSDQMNEKVKGRPSSPKIPLIDSVDSCRKNPNLHLGELQNDGGENVAADAEESGGCLMNVSDSRKAGSVAGLNTSIPIDEPYGGFKNARYNSNESIFSYDLFVKLYTSNREDMQPSGLVNCGNSCYANVVLQCLAFTPPLTAYFVQGFHSKACTSKEWCFTCEFENLVLKVKEGKSPVSPAAILSQLHNIARQLGAGSEEDAHEFLRCAVETMQCVFLKESGARSPGPFEEETTLTSLTFGGYLLSKIKCLKCQYKSERQERMMDLTVEIGGDVGKLEDALRRFTCTEILDGDNKYRCDICKSYERAKKKLSILEAPNVLTIALKRFQSGKFGKLNKSIGLPEILDLAPYMSDTSDMSPIYRLYGVVVHLDAMNSVLSGHYVCYIKNFRNKWFQIDDSRVMDADLQRVLSTRAYMLLYARCSPRAPRCVKSRYVGMDAKNSGGADKVSSVEAFYMKFNRLARILKDDSSSDGYSFASSNSDESCCSSESTRDSTSTDDLSDTIFGRWSNSSWKMALDSDTTTTTTTTAAAAAACSPPSSPPCSRQSRENALSSCEEECGDGFARPRRKLASSNCCRMTTNSKLGGRANNNPLRNVRI